MGNSQVVLGRHLFMSDFGLPTIAALLCRVVFFRLPTIAVLLCARVVFAQRDPGLLFLPRRVTASDESAVTLLLDIGPCFSGRTTGLII